MAECMQRSSMMKCWAVPIGESLLLSAFADLKESNLRMVEVCVHPSNYKALKIYREALGFNVINAQDEASYEDVDFLVLRKTL